MFNGPNLAKASAQTTKERLMPSESHKVEDREPYITYTPNRKTRKVLCGIAAYNEEIAIGSMVVRSKQYVDEVLVVDDGSRDTTGETAQLVGATVICHPKRLGKADGVRTILGYAEERSFDALVLIDGDGQHNPDEIPKVLTPVLDQQADLCIGCRDGNSEIPYWRRIGKNVLDLLTNRNLDTQSGFRGLSESTVRLMREASRSKGFGIESEMIKIAKRKALRIEEVSITCRYRGINGSSLHPLQHSISVIMSIIQGRIDRSSQDTGKIKTYEEVQSIVRNLRSKSKNIVFTNGCFDILHIGHIKYLEKAKRLGDILIIAINSDASVRANKGYARPFTNETQRAHTLAALECVNLIFIFEDKTIERILETMKPEIYVKGGDYRIVPKPF